MTRDEMRDWRVQDVAKDIVETHAQATPRDWGSPDHALYKLIVAKLVAERDRIAALRSRPAPDEDEGDKAKHMRDSQPRFSQYQMDAATKPLHAEIERLRSRPAPPDDLVALVDALIKAANRRKGLQHGVARVTAEHDEARAYEALLAWAAPAPVAAPAPETPAPDAMPEKGWAAEMLAETAAWAGSCEGCPYPDTCSWFRRCTFRRRQEAQP